MKPSSASELLAPYQSLQLSAWDNLRLAASVLSLAGLSYQTMQVVVSHAASTDEAMPQKPRYWLKCGDELLDCGRINDYAASMAWLTSTPTLSECQQLAVSVLDLERIALLCMQSAHFDHCAF
ncbi:hypothetical protein NFHSH190041_09590 [Shewanella sp. NFH-SH190041]|uniref:hypothetical protein n=1 Tax=Shewanella sp. NFH-SH190041 TaxID=2950245 RepID=UPI0021C27F4C|nr:hypothetical protein [Shewanella sp. NFH-SH190041]BDM63507.1 hypothetical protein NFHSH190041_09590 [Shewanella sp. NFH-SH190041]